MKLVYTTMVQYITEFVLPGSTKASLRHGYRQFNGKYVPERYLADLPSVTIGAISVIGRSRFILPFLISTLLVACATKNVQRPELIDNSASDCQAPSGFYSNFGQALGGLQTNTPPLSSLLWEGELAGFNIDRVSLETGTDGKLVISAWVGATKLDERLEFSPQDRDCDDGRWRFTTRWDAQILGGVVAGLLWTGGIFLPAAERDEYSLLFTEGGDLSVRYIGRLTGTVFIFFPMYMKAEEIWFLYDQIDEHMPVTGSLQ